MTARLLALCALVALMACVYLFVNAPAPLPDLAIASSRGVPARELLEICAAENGAVRELYTKRIVEAGLKAGLKFDEQWQDATIDAGPLPALFLRETAKSLARGPTHLGLFLGSDAPINKANQFSGAQADAFEQLRRDRAPRHFFIDDTQAHTAMFPDVAVARACVDCHNRHADSRKRDWKLNDVMGATTWTVTSSTFSLAQAMDTVTALRQAFRDAYASYIEKARQFSSPPEIGKRWPSEGYCLPDPDTFMEEATQRASRATLERLLALR
jgi:adenylate cyclase